MKMRQSIIDDDFWTPLELYERLCKLYDIHPKLDVAASSKNTKCEAWLENAMFEEWIIPLPNGLFVSEVWCNPPHSMTEEFIRRADSQHKKYNINIMMIVPSNTESTKVWSELIENDYEDLVENHRVEGRPRFLQHGNTKTKFSSRNAYRVLIWRSR
jgi:phage N-6-adenine-methyltransferase